MQPLYMCILTLNIALFWSCIPLCVLLTNSLFTHMHMFNITKYIQNFKRNTIILLGLGNEDSILKHMWEGCVRSAA